MPGVAARQSDGVTGQGAMKFIKWLANTVFFYVANTVLYGGICYLLWKRMEGTITQTEQNVLSFAIFVGAIWHLFGTILTAYVAGTLSNYVDEYEKVTSTPAGILADTLSSALMGAMDKGYGEKVKKQKALRNASVE